MATLVNYTWKRFIKLTSGHRGWHREASHDLHRRVRKGHRRNGGRCSSLIRDPKTWGISSEYVAKAEVVSRFLYLTKFNPQLTLTDTAFSVWLKHVTSPTRAGRVFPVANVHHSAFVFTSSIVNRTVYGGCNKTKIITLKN